MKVVTSIEKNLLLGPLSTVVHDFINLLLLLPLHLNQTLIDRVLDAHAAHECLVLLADTEDPTESLLLRSLVPPRVDDDHFRGHGQVETETAAAKRRQQHGRLGIVGELFDSLVASTQAELAMVLWT